jgi:hypothetical protein
MVSPGKQESIRFEDDGLCSNEPVKTEEFASGPEAAPSKPKFGPFRK